MTVARNYLQIAKDAYSASTTYVDANYRKKWEDAICMFQSRHPADSKYNTQAYQHRSKLFRPKSRSMVRKHEAATAEAFFSNIDTIATSAVDEDNKDQAASAALMKELLNYRLTKTIPWFLTVCGAMQDAMTVGVVCSYQYWMYADKRGEERMEPIIDEATGQPMYDEVSGAMMVRRVQDRKVLADKPCVELLPCENVRIDPGASWIDPINSSPYVIHMRPMYIVDIKARMKQPDVKTGQPKWKTLSDGEIRSATKQVYDSTTQTREGKRQDPYDAGNAPLGDFEIAWVHENFVRLDGEDVVYYTLGVEHMLTDPVPIEEIYFTGERPIIMGACVIETHKIMPDSPVMLGEQLQREANQIANQRIDNVQLVLNKRFVAKRGAQVDLKSLVRNVPGSITLANDPTGDIRPLDFVDVTSSAYAEQDRINVDYDELTGNFSQGSVMTNRKMGETVGGMAMISNSANRLVDYTIRTFTETWVEPVLRQLTKLEQKYETDEVVLAICGRKAKLLEKYGVSEITDSLLNQDLTLNVNVGMGATDPNVRMGRFIGAMKAYAEVSSIEAPGLDKQEVGKEVFSLSGYRDGARFMTEEGENPQVKQIMEQAQAFVQQAMGQVEQEKAKLQDQQSKMETAKVQLQRQADEIDSKQTLFNENVKHTMKELGLTEDLITKNIELVATRNANLIDGGDVALTVEQLLAQASNSMSEMLEQNRFEQEARMQDMLAGVQEQIAGSQVVGQRRIEGPDGRLIGVVKVLANGEEIPVEIQ